MSDSRRVRKFADLIKRNLSNIIEFKMEDPRKGMITLTRVKVSPDLKIATVYYTVLGDTVQMEQTKTVLKKSNAFLRNELKPFITSRWLPELRFFYDESFSQAERINELLKQIEHDSRADKKQSHSQENSE